MEEIYIDGIHEYDYLKTETKDQTVHTLYYSDHIEWDSNIAGTKAIELIDTHNDVIIEKIDTTKPMNYLQVEQLHIILRLYSQETAYEIAPQPVKKDF